MASSYSTTLVASSLPMKIVPYIPRPSKSKPRQQKKAKLVATAETAEQSGPGVDSSEDGGEWFHIDDDFPVLGSGAPLPPLFEAGGASSSADHDVVNGLGAASESEKQELYQLGRESIDGGRTDRATCVAKTNSAINGLLDGSCREFPLIVESGAAAEHDSTTHVEPSNGASSGEENSYHADARQYSDVDEAGAGASSAEHMESTRHVGIAITAKHT